MVLVLVRKSNKCLHRWTPLTIRKCQLFKKKKKQGKRPLQFSNSKVSSLLQVLRSLCRLFVGLALMEQNFKGGSMQGGRLQPLWQRLGEALGGGGEVGGGVRVPHCQLLHNCPGRWEHLNPVCKLLFTATRLDTSPFSVLRNFAKYTKQFFGKET